MRTRWLGRVAVALALASAGCGGSARSGSNATGGVGAPSSGAGGQSSGEPSGSTGGGQPSSTGGGPSSFGGEPSGAGGVAGAASSCVGLGCLAGAQFIYQPTRTWHAPAGPPGSFNELAEADYTPMQGATIALRFSDEATELQLSPTAGGATVIGTRDAAHADRAWYELQLFAGGRFVVQAADGQFTAEHTVYGSGSPIISSTRGVLKALP